MVLLYSVILYPLFPKYFREATHKNKLKKIVLIGIMIVGLYLVNF